MIIGAILVGSVLGYGAAGLTLMLGGSFALAVLAFLGASLAAVAVAFGLQALRRHRCRSFRSDLRGPETAKV